MSHLRARPKPESSLRRKNSNSSLASSTTSDQKSRDGKSAKYRSPSYETVLATKGSFMAESDLEVTDLSKGWCQKLLYEKQKTPKDTFFKDDRFRTACQKLQSKNESRVIQGISRLIVPSAEGLATNGAKDLENLVESVNESWRSSLAFCGPLPQPDYAVGFARSAFSNTQLEKLAPFIGEVPNLCNSYFLATFYMHFPFLTCEVKCGASALDIADRQNAHSMTLAVRAVAELFKFVGREEEINREILAFSISHDHRSVRIFTALDGKEKWTAYHFTRNVYDIWRPNHLSRVCSAIDDIPFRVDLGVSQPDPGSQSNVPSFTEGDDIQVTQASLVASVEVTPNSSFTEQTKQSKQAKQTISNMAKKVRIMQIANY
ncbi:hypothetical protein AJ78_06957 [Emergomyces pasteurianus Ep9510]|uniref:DUF7924 domain-containing protein n=1 Tax=Emergomyces pasteurianus Ep9510 TaxID=1447872 RepID=A0A1J9P934_9EURO|nr:hypothetical protein AJ78_06957 [Emergomyces pasteurianus Ep9510]